MDARGLLRSACVGINDADNGVFLRRGNSVSEVGADHRVIHTERYYTEVKERLTGARSPEVARDILRQIAEELKNDTFPY